MEILKLNVYLQIIYLVMIFMLQIQKPVERKAIITSPVACPYAALLLSKPPSGECERGSRHAAGRYNTRNAPLGQTRRLRAVERTEGSCRLYIYIMRAVKGSVAKKSHCDIILSPLLQYVKSKQTKTVFCLNKACRGFLCWPPYSRSFPISGRVA